MPNIVAHNHLIREYLDNATPDMALGSVLPDFAGMYLDYHRTEVAVKGHNRSIDLGVYFHGKSDRIYDSQPEKLKIAQNLEAHLKKVGIAERAAKIGADFLTDVMLDGTLMRDDHQAAADYETLADDVLYYDTSLEKGFFPPAFVEFVNGYFERDIPYKYREPETLAKITQKRLHDRSIRRGTGPERRITEAQIPAVAEVIDIQYERVRRLGALALERTVHTLQSEPTYS